MNNDLPIIRNKVIEALKSLWEAKQEKELHGKSELYQMLKVIAWEKAEKILRSLGEIE